MDEYSMAKRVLMEVVSGVWEQRLGWMIGVNVTSGSRGMTIEGARQKLWRSGQPGEYVDDWVSCGQFCTLPVFFRTPPRALVAYNQERGGMLLHDTVGMNCQKGATTEYQDAGAKYMDWVVYIG